MGSGDDPIKYLYRKARCVHRYVGTCTLAEAFLQVHVIMYPGGRWAGEGRQPDRLTAACFAKHPSIIDVIPRLDLFGHGALMTVASSIQSRNSKTTTKARPDL